MGRAGRGRRRWLPALAACLLAACAGARAGDETTVFRIGTHDGLTAEFDAAPDFRTRAAPVRFTVGRDSPAAWPRIHPSSNDKWAGSRPHTFGIRFKTARRWPGRLFLLLGLTNSHPSEPSTITVTVNGSSLPPQRAPKGEGHVAAGRESMVVFELPAGAVRTGTNRIDIRLEGGSWIFYDYLALGTTRRPPRRTDPLKALRAGPLAGLRQIVYAVRQPGKDQHYYANFGYWSEDPRRKLYGDGGQLCRLDVASGELKVLLDDPRGGVRDPHVHYGGRKILFSYRKGGSPYYHLHEINADGTGLRQLTDGPFDDIEPAYLPCGDIVFASSRCRRWVACWYVHVAILYRCDGDGGNLRPLSSNAVTESTPAVLPDGRVLYTRWEYVDRSQIAYHHLWTMNPDGTAQMAFFGNMHPTGRRMNARKIAGTKLYRFDNVAGAEVMIDARPIPGTDEVVAIFSPGHGRREHAGPVVIVDPKAGPDAVPLARRISRSGDLRDPCPLSAGHFLVARRREVLVMDRAGHAVPLHAIRCKYPGVEVHEPVPLRPRPREPVIPSRVDPAKTTGVLVLADVTRGRKMAGVEPGEVRRLLVLEQLPAPVHMSPGFDGITHWGTFTLTRIVGTVPVEADGSACMELPAMRSLFFVALDGRDLSVKRMQSFLTVRPGERTGCVGCHEARTEVPRAGRHLLALARPPRRPRPVAGVPDVPDFPRDVQPVLDRHCVRCHDYDPHPGGLGPRAGGAILTGDRGPWFSHAYFTLVSMNQVADGRNAHGNRAPRTIGSSASALMAKIDGRHHGVKLSAGERTVIRLWIDASAHYAGTYAECGSGKADVGPKGRALINGVLGRRCHRCHKGNYRQPWELLHNFSRPDKSLLLLAPLAKRAGGLGLCRPKAAGKPADVFADRGDPDYLKLLEGTAWGKRNLDRVKRFDMPGFRPNRHYVREMVRYGVLPAAARPAEAIDVYATDRAYWRSLWHRPPRGGARGQGD